MINVKDLNFNKKRIIDEKYRVPEGQYIVNDWPVLDLGEHPLVKLEDWKLELAGSINNPCVLTHQDIIKLPLIEVTADWHCVTTWTMQDNRWQGVLLKDIIKIAQPTEKAKYLYFESYDGYTTNTSLDVGMENDSLLIFARNDEPIPREHGGPYRIIISQRYAWKSPKWIHKIHFMEWDKKGYWEVRGYHNNADYKTEERFS